MKTLSLVFFYNSFAIIVSGKNERNQSMLPSESIFLIETVSSKTLVLTNEF